MRFFFFPGFPDFPVSAPPAGRTTEEIGDCQSGSEGQQQTSEPIHREEK
jgi:hypothetical protein